MRGGRWVAVVGVGALLVAAIVVWSPWSSQQTSAGAEQRPGLQLVAHRGVHQTFDRDGLTDETCTAERIDPPTHSYLENTVASTAAAFDAGAAVVEIDIAPTVDDVLVVFHDWTVDCRTEGSGAVRDMSWGELSTLDVGFGYTSDGTTFPFRGQGVGLMPTLEDVDGPSSRTQRGRGFTVRF